MSVPPLHQFDVYISKNVNDDSVWNATINRVSFPYVNQSNDKKQLFHLNEIKYRKSFSSFLQLCDSLPSKLFDYTISIEGDNLVIAGLTETTVRVAIVDLITERLPCASVKMIKPPINFRVYIPTEPEIPDGGFEMCNIGMLGGGDY